MNQPFYEGILDPLTYDEVAALLDYDPDTGVVRWKVDHGWYKAGTPINAACGDVVLQGDSVRLRRVVWLLHYGEWPIGMIRSLDENKCNLRINNLADGGKLRGATIAPKFRGRRGVSLDWNRYRASGTKGDHFDTQEEAAQAVDQAMLAKFGYRVNFVSDEEAAVAIAKAREPAVARERLRLRRQEREGYRVLRERRALAHKAARATPVLAGSTR